MIPEKYGGNGLGFLAMVLITEEVARVHSAVRVAINMQIGPALALCSSVTRSRKRDGFHMRYCVESSSVVSPSPSLMPVRM